ncbi:MAG: hypothetical protein LM576_05980 [Thermofilum sp.]|nr:hypothetical protein [Thermofilum sp.]
MEEVVRSLTELHALVSILKERGEVRRRIAELLGRTIKLGEATGAKFRYAKTLGELPPSKKALLKVLSEFSYAPYTPGMRVELVINNHYVYIAEEGREDITIDSGHLGTGIYGGIKMEFFLKLALYFDERDWEEMKRLARERLREETELLEKLKAAAAAIELLLK